MKKIFSLNKILIMALIISLLSTIVGCSKKDTTDATQDYQKLNIGVMPDLDSLPFIIAQHNGYFQEEGLEVHIEHFKSALDRDSALQTGNIDGAVSDMLPVVFFNDGGFNVKITSKTNGSFKLIAGSNSNISELKDIKNNSIGISKNTIIEYLTDRILERSDISLENVEKVAIPKIPTRLEMLQNGNLDMATLPEPLGSLATVSGGKILSSSEEVGLNPGIMLFSQKAIEEKSEELKAFYRAYNKATEYLNNTDIEEYFNVLIEEAGFPAPIKETLTLPTYSKATMPTEEELQDVILWLRDNNLTDSNYTLDELSDNSFLE